MASHKVVVVLGAGPNIGTKVAEKFTSSGYRVAVISRSGKEVPSTTAALSIAADLSKSEKVLAIFAEVREKLGEPSVVIYNAGAFAFPSPTDPFSIDVVNFAEHFAINTTSAYAAAKEALASFEAIKESILKVYIYTGNCLNTMVMNPAVTLGVGKAASAHFIEIASQAYGPKGYTFYYADERTPEGKAVAREVSGEAHAEHYLKLASEKEQGEWQQTFVKEKGYTKF